MARNNNNTTPEQKGNIRFMLLEVSGSNQTLQESIRGISKALGFETNSRTLKLIRPENAEESIILDVEESLQEEIVFEASAEESPSPKRAKARLPKKPKLLTDLDFSGFETFYEPIGSVKDTVRYQAIAYWLAKNRSLQSIGADHVYTAYKHMRWSDLPAEPTKPFRNMLNDKFISGDPSGTWELTHIGENSIEAFLNGSSQ